MDVDPYEAPPDPKQDYCLTFKANPKDTVVSETSLVALRAWSHFLSSMNSCPLNLLSFDFDIGYGVPKSMAVSMESNWRREGR